MTYTGYSADPAVIRGYENTPGNIRANQVYGPVWTLGVRGRY